MISISAEPMDHQQQQQQQHRGPPQSAPLSDVYFSGASSHNINHHNVQYFPSNFNPYLHHNQPLYSTPQQRMQQGHFLNNNNNTINLLYGSESVVAAPSQSPQQGGAQQPPPWALAVQQQVHPQLAFCPPPPFVTMGDFAYTEEFFKFRLASCKLTTLVRSAEIILTKMLPWVDIRVQGEIHEWFVSKEEYVACVLSEPEGPWYEFLLPQTNAQIQQSGGHNESQVCAQEGVESSSTSSSNDHEGNVEPVEDEDSDRSYGCSPTTSDKEITEGEEECEREPEDSDCEDFEEDDESSGSNTEALLNQIETNFKAALDNKIAEAEVFFDRHDFAVSAIPSNVEIRNIPPDPFVVETVLAVSDTGSGSAMRKVGPKGSHTSFQRVVSHTSCEEDVMIGDAPSNEFLEPHFNYSRTIRTKKVLSFKHSKSDGDLPLMSRNLRVRTKTVSGCDTGYGMSPVEKITSCLAELEDILQQSSVKSFAKPESEGGLSSNEQSLQLPLVLQTVVSPLVQKSVVQLIQTVREVLVKGSTSPPLSTSRTHSSGHVSEDNTNVVPAGAQLQSTPLFAAPVFSDTSECGADKGIKLNVETQTDDTSYSGYLVERIGPVTEEELGTVARVEISHLRDARMSLVNQRKDVSDKMKQSGPSGDELKEEERRLYEYEEAIEAIDTAIEYKNEVILGHKCILSNQSAPGKNEADLVTRLTSLTVLDLQRLLSKYFSKVVELRFNSRKLEKSLEKHETEREKLTRRVAMDHKFLKQKDFEHESRIKHLLRECNKDPNSAMGNHIRSLERSLSSAQRKQYDLERSLTELLVRHGYLLNGADYDVKQVVRMLGIDTTQVGLHWKDERGKSSKFRNEAGVGTPSLLPPKLVSALESGSSGQGISRRMREQQFNQQRNQPHYSTYNSTSQAQQQTPLQLQQLPSSGTHHYRRPHHSSSHYNYHQQSHSNYGHGGASGGTSGGGHSSSRLDPQSGRGRTHDREVDDSNQNHQLVNEVRRHKKKLIIQPSSQQANQHHNYSNNH